MKKEEVDRVRELLVETISTLCRNSMDYNSAIRIEGLLGVTLDEEDVILINVNKTYKCQASDEDQGDCNLEQQDTCESQSNLSTKRRLTDDGRPVAKRRKRKKSSADAVPIDIAPIIPEYSTNFSNNSTSWASGLPLQGSADYMDNGQIGSVSNNATEEVEHVEEAIGGTDSEHQVKMELQNSEDSEHVKYVVYGEPQYEVHEVSEYNTAMQVEGDITTDTVMPGTSEQSESVTYQDGSFYTPQRYSGKPDSSNTLSDAEIFEAAKERIDHLESKPRGRGRRGHYRKFDDQTRLAIAKSCIEVGPSVTSRRYNISESTARCMKKAYLRLQAQNPGEGHTSLPCSPRGRPCMIGDFDKKVQECIRAMKENGCKITTRIVMEAAQGIMTRFAKDQLAAYGGHAKITIKWARSLLIRMGYLKAKETKSEDTWVKNVKKMIKDNNIPDELVIHWSETGFNLTPCAEQMDMDGVLYPDKRQVTALLSITKSGEILPPQVLYRGKTSQCVPNTEFPADWDVHFTSDLSSNEFTLQRFINNIIVPYVEEKRNKIGILTQPALVLFHRFRNSATTSQVIESLEQHNINHYLVTNDPLEQIDLPVLQALQDTLVNEYNLWYFYQVEQLTENRDECQPDSVDTSMIRMKPLHASWLVQTFKDNVNKTEIIQAGFVKAQLLEKE